MMDDIEVLDVEFTSDDLGRKVTIREYFKALLHALWTEGEGFSGKRPLGNSDWQFDIYRVLIANGFIEGKLDSDGYVDKCDREVADRFVVEHIIARL